VSIKERLSCFFYYLILCIFLSVGLTFIVGIAFAWVGSNPTVRVVYPDAIGDADICKVPINVAIEQYNTEQGIDHTEVWFLEESDGDTYVSQAEWDARVDIPYTGAKIEDINREAPFVIAELGTDQITEDSPYYIIIVGQDLNGDWSADTTLIPGVSMDGDANLADSAISYFIGGGKR